MRRMSAVYGGDWRSMNGCKAPFWVALSALLLCATGTAHGATPKKANPVAEKSDPAHKKTSVVVKKASPTPKKAAKSGPKTAKKAAASKTKMTWQCHVCHTTAGWSAIPKRITFDHRKTGVPLFGAHKTAPCVGCHKPHRRAGKVPRECVACHTDSNGLDAHRGELGKRCEDCHTTTTWNRPRRFPKHDATRFPLTGAHTFVACRSCHTRRGRDTYRGTPATCDGCHKKTALAVGYFPHDQLSTGCNQCHSTFAWSPARVDHSIWWPLLGRHAEITACKTCHTTGKFSDQSRFCIGCHQPARDKAYPNHKALGFGDTCDNCHQSFGWKFLRPGFHEKWFALQSGPHRKFAGGGQCSSCHTQGIGGGKFECTGCHDGTHEKTRTEALHKHIGGFQYKNTACKSCHPTGKL